MTVIELKKMMENLPDDMKVLVNGYEDGLDEIGRAETVKVAFNINSEAWNGPHEIDEDSKNEAFLIGRTSF